jgi:hypothetical protein
MSADIESLINQILSVSREPSPILDPDSTPGSTPGPDKVIKIWQILAQINTLMENTEPWSGFQKYQLRVIQEGYQSHILSMVYPNWIRNTLISEDQLFHMKLVKLSTVITAEFLEISIPESRQYLIDNASQELQQLDKHYMESPFRLLLCIYKCVNSLIVALHNTDANRLGVDSLINLFILCLIQAQPHHLISICHWIDEYSDPDSNRSSELFYMYTHLLVVISYIYSVECATVSSYRLIKDKFLSLIPSLPMRPSVHLVPSLPMVPSIPPLTTIASYIPDLSNLPTYSLLVKCSQYFSNKTTTRQQPKN